MLNAKNAESRLLMLLRKSVTRFWFGRGGTNLFEFGKIQVALGELLPQRDVQSHFCVVIVAA